MRRFVRTPEHVLTIKNAVLDLMVNRLKRENERLRKELEREKRTVRTLTIALGEIKGE